MYCFPPAPSFAASLAPADTEGIETEVVEPAPVAAAFPGADDDFPNKTAGAGAFGFAPLALGPDACCGCCMCPEIMSVNSSFAPPSMYGATFRRVTYRWNA